MPKVTRAGGTMSPIACQAAIAKWLYQKHGLVVGSSSLFGADDRLWIEFRDLADRDEPEDQKIPYLRGVLYRRVPEDMNDPLMSNDTIVLRLYSSNPTRAEGEEPAPAEFIVGLTEWQGAIARDVTFSPTEWGTYKIRWPFED